MIRSMTGYGSAERTVDGVGYAVEIRSVNHRYLKLSFKLPESLQAFETELEKLVRSRLARGSVSLSLRIRCEAGAGVRPVNQAALQHYLNALVPVMENLGSKATIDIASLVQLPGVFEPVEIDDETLGKQLQTVSATTNDALDVLVTMRGDEGRTLQGELCGMCDSIREQLGEVEKRAPVVVEEYHEKLKSRVNLLMKSGGFELEADGLMREVAIYAERSDIAEEVTRLRSHLDQVAQLCEREDQVGRTLDFLAQEMLREANTIASKSNDAEVVRRVLEIKGLIDRVKEQVQNVE